MTIDDVHYHRHAREIERVRGSHVRMETRTNKKILSNISITGPCTNYNRYNTMYGGRVRNMKHLQKQQTIKHPQKYG